MTGDLSPVYPMASGDPEDASDGRSSTTDLCWPHQDSYSETSSISEANSTDETSSTMHSDKPLSKRALRLQQRNARREAAMAAERAITDLSAAFESLGHDAPADMTFEQASAVHQYPDEENPPLQTGEEAVAEQALSEDVIAGEAVAEDTIAEDDVAEKTDIEQGEDEHLADADTEAPPDWAKIYPHTHAKPKTMLEALAVFETADIQEEVIADGEDKVKDENKKKAKRDRYSLAPTHSPGQASNTVNKTPLLQVIMSKDPILREKGIKIVFNDDMLVNRLEAFVSMVNNKPSARADGRISKRLKKLCASIERANHVLKSEISTAETTSTGILRATLYSVLNDVLADPDFLKAEYRDAIGRLAYGDPATTTASIADVTGWSIPRWMKRRLPDFRKARSKVTVEHKRKRCLTDELLAIIHQLFEKGRRRRTLRITLEPDGTLKWSGLMHKKYEHLRRQLSQVITQMFSNKTADGILYNTSGLRVFSRTKKYNVLEMSDFCGPTAARQNVKSDGQVKHSTKLRPTPVLVFLSILATSPTLPVEQFPKTKFKLQKKNSASAEGAQASSTDAWADAPGDELPDLREDLIDLDMLPIVETPDAALPTAPIPPPAATPTFFPGKSLRLSPLADQPSPLARRVGDNRSKLRQSTASSESSSARQSSSSSARSSLRRSEGSTAPSSLRQSTASTEDSGASGISRWPQPDFPVYDLLAADMDADIYNIKLNALWKPIHAPDSPVGLRILEPGAPRTATSGTRQVVIHKIISYGRLYSTYGGVLRDVDCAEDDVDVVIKFAYPDRYPAVPATTNGHTFATARDAFLRETSIYQNELSALQGTVVPEFYGSFVNAEGVFAMILQYGGRQVCGDDEYQDFGSMSKEITSRLPGLYEKLHRAGVIHNDLEPRHVLQSTDLDADDPRLLLIDFEGSIVPPKTQLHHLAAAEMARLATLCRGEAK